MHCESFMSLVKRRRSTKRFSETPLPQGCLEKIVEAAQYAPSGYNCQLWEFVVVDDVAVKDKIGDIVDTKMNADAIRQAPALIIALGDTRVRDCGPFKEKQFDEKWKSVFYSSMAIAVEHMFLAVVSLGLGAKWFSCYPQIADEIKAYLGIPDYLAFYEMMVVGYAGEDEPKAKRMRPMTSIVHYNVYTEDDFRSDEEVKLHFT